MNLKELQDTLRQHPELAFQLELPGGQLIPAHFHVTEVGHVTKDFVDCGGVRRATSACVLQTLVASDVDHRLGTTKFARILSMADQVVPDMNVPVEVEYDTGTISNFVVQESKTTNDAFTLVLAAKHTACLAPDKCGLDILPTVANVSLEQACDPATDC